MGRNRVIYRHWFASLAAPTEPGPGERADSQRQDEIIQRVRTALEMLEPIERELIERYYLRFDDYAAIAESLKIKPHRLDTIHARAIRKLRKELGQFVASAFGITTAPDGNCCICNSIHREIIEQMIASRDPRRPWRIVIRQIREQFGLRIRNYQSIQSHLRYH